MSKEIYLDNAASFKPEEKILKKTFEKIKNSYGNPNSIHAIGEIRFSELLAVKKKIAKELNCSEGEIIFTSGATESNNLAIFGYLNRIKSKKTTIITSKIEHPSVLEPISIMKTKGYNVIEISVNSEGFIDLNELESMLKKKNVTIVSIMHGNNLFGTTQDLEAIGKLCEKYNVVFHTDASQSFMKSKIDVKKSKIGLVSGSGHKIGAFRGIGFLYVNKDIELKPEIYGGGQEKGFRSGTQNMEGIISLEVAIDNFQSEKLKELEKMKNYLIKQLESLGWNIDGSKNNCLPNILHANFSGINSEMLVLHLSNKNIFVSGGSACESKKKNEKKALEALGLNDKQIEGSIRISLGFENKIKDCKELIIQIKKFMERNV